MVSPRISFINVNLEGLAKYGEVTKYNIKNNNTVKMFKYILIQSNFVKKGSGNKSRRLLYLK